MDREANSLDIELNQEHRQKVLEDMEDRQRRDRAAADSTDQLQRDMQLQTSIAWLGINDTDQENELVSMCGTRCPRTFEWIEKVADVQHWLHNSTPASLLWLNGKPGAGTIVKIHFVFADR